jgi:hypothetical protein
MPDESFRLLVEPLDLGPDVRAIGIELVERSEEEDDAPARGAEAASIWAATLIAMAGTEPWALDFFSHLDRLHDFCRSHGIAWRDAAARCSVISKLEQVPLSVLIERFQAETFGFRAGALVESGDSALENDLARRGVDAYHQAYQNYFACGVCDFENGALTVLSAKLSSSELIRRFRKALDGRPVRVERPE